MTEQNDFVKDVEATAAGVYAAHYLIRASENHAAWWASLPPVVQAAYRQYKRQTWTMALGVLLVPGALAFMVQAGTVKGILGLIAFVVPAVILGYRSGHGPSKVVLDRAWDTYFRSLGTSLAEVIRYRNAEANRQFAYDQAQRQAWRDHMDETIQRWGNH
jgi:hypothetical protein